MADSSDVGQAAAAVGALAGVGALIGFGVQGLGAPTWEAAAVGFGAVAGFVGVVMGREWALELWWRRVGR